MQSDVLRKREVRSAKGTSFCDIAAAFFFRELDEEPPKPIPPPWRPNLHSLELSIVWTLVFRMLLRYLGCEVYPLTLLRRYRLS